MLLCTISYGQDKEEIRKRAVLIAHADFTDFSFTNSNSIDSIVCQYNSHFLKSSGMAKECYFIDITPLYCNQCKDCKMLIAYSLEYKRYFRLRGFRYNEFNLFFNLVLLDDYSYSSGRDIKNNRKSRKLLFKIITIEDYKLLELYKSYYQKQQQLTIDKEACYYRSRIFEH